MKKYLKLLLLAMALAAVLFTSCQHEENEIGQENPENLTQSSELTHLLKRVSGSTTDNDDAIDSTACVSIKMPYAIWVHDQQPGGAAIEYQQQITSEAELADAITLIEGLEYPQDHFSLVFPVTAVYANGQEQVVQSQEVLDGIGQQCTSDPASDNIYCININYPITVFSYNSNFQLAETYTITNDFELFTMIMNMVPSAFYAIDYPILITKYSGQVVEIHNNAELLAAIQAAIEDCSGPVINPCPNPDILTDGLIIYMPFANEAKDLVSMEGAVFNDNYPPVFVTDRNGNANSAVTFSGISDYDYLKIPVTDSNNIEYGDPMTISLWFKMQNTNPSNLERLFQKAGNTNSGGFGLWVYDMNTPLFYGATPMVNVWDNTWNSDPLLHQDISNWHHLAVTVKTTSTATGTLNIIKLYRDGMLKSTLESSNLFLNTQVYDYFIGKNYKGYIDDLRVYRHTLSAAEIQTLYNLEGDDNTCLD